mgnify:CR=1 FL=1
MADWKIKRQVLRAASVCMVLFGILAVYVIYLSTWEADDLAHNPLNMRSAAARSDIVRGSILSADGKVLAQTEADGKRVYPFGDVMAAVTGYNGEQIGSAGIEGHANPALLGITGDMSRLGPLAQLLQSDRGNDVKLTIDSRTSRQLFQDLAAGAGLWWYSMRVLGLSWPWSARLPMTRMISRPTGRTFRSRKQVRCSIAQSRVFIRLARPSSR